MSQTPLTDKIVTDRFVFLEEKLAFQQRMLDELNTVVVGQQAELARLTSEISRLSETLRTVMERTGDDLPHEKPPHY